MRNIQVVEKQVEEKEKAISDLELDLNIFKIAIGAMVDDLEKVKPTFEKYDGEIQESQESQDSFIDMPNIPEAP